MKRERRYMRLQDIGCIACLKEGLPIEPADMHHVVDKGTRAHSGGDAATVPLCPWHHRGDPRDGESVDEALYRRGPSLDRHKRLFVKIYGTERELLAEANEMILKAENEQLRFAAEMNAETIKEMARHG
jgi:hypothetical protein